MKFKILLLLGAVAPILLAGQHAAATEHASGIVVAQQQTDTNKADGDKDKKRNKDKRKDRAKDDRTPAAKPGQAKHDRKSDGDRKSAQESIQQPAAKAPAAITDSDKRKRGGKQNDEAERRQIRDKSGQPTGQQQTQPAVTNQPVVTQQPAIQKSGRTAEKKLLKDLRSQRKETREGDRTVIRDGVAIKREVPDYAELDDLMGAE